MNSRIAVLAVVGLALVTACANDPKTSQAQWSLVASELPSALLAVGGTAADDVWAVGADKGQGQLVLHFDGAAWTEVPTGHRGSLWWVHAFSRTEAVFGGANANLLLWRDGVITRLPTPGLGRHTVFGVWGESASDFYAVGSAGSRNGFIWRYDGAQFTELALPEDIPTVGGDLPGLFKIWGDEQGHVWAVGARGLVLKSTNGADFERVPTDTDATLFTVAGHGGRCVVVGGGAEAVIFEETGAGFTRDDPADLALLQGVSFNASGVGFASGEAGALLERTEQGWEVADTGLTITAQSLHAVWVDPDGGVWSVGGNVLNSLDAGVIVHRGAKALPAPVVKSAAARGHHLPGRRGGARARQDRGASLERADPQRHPQGHPAAGRPRAKPLPPVGGHVRRVGGLRPDRRRRVRRRGGDQRRRRRRARRGHQLRRVPRADAPLPAEALGRRHAVAGLLHEVHGRARLRPRRPERGRPEPARARQPHRRRDHRRLGRGRRQRGRELRRHHGLELGQPAAGGRGRRHHGGRTPRSGSR